MYLFQQPEAAQLHMTHAGCTCGSDSLIDLSQCRTSPFSFFTSSHHISVLLKIAIGENEMSTSDKEEKPSFTSQADIKHLNRSKRILALCGASLSAQSGFPIFTNEGAMWNNHKVAALSNINTFESNPGLVWKYSADRRTRALKTKPNKAHAALAKTAMRRPVMVCITQNIDGKS